MTNRLLFWLRRVPSGLWGILALFGLLGIPNPVHTLSLPDKPIFAQVRADALRTLIIQCIASSLLVTLCVWRSDDAVNSERSANDGSPSDPRGRRLQFSIFDMLCWTTIVALCLSLWRWFDSWLLAVMAGTFAYQAFVLLRLPKRLSIQRQLRQFVHRDHWLVLRRLPKWLSFGIAWVIVWGIVVLMVAWGVG